MTSSSGPAIISPNETNSFNSLAISRPVLIYMRSQSTIIIVLNFIVFVTLISKKRKFPAVYWLQMFCLAFNDILAGIANFLISFIDFQAFKESFTNCSIAIVFLYSSQSASLYNILGICIHRFIVLKRFDANSNIWKHRHTLLCTSFSWILSLTVCSLPVLLYKKSRDYSKTNVCSVQHLFGEDVRKGILILMGSFIVPLIFTNILYTVLFCILRSAWKTVKPIGTASNSEIGSLCSISGALLNEIPKKRTKMVTTISDKSILGEKELSQLRKPTGTSLDRLKRSQTYNRLQFNSKLTFQSKQKCINLNKRRKTVQQLSIRPLYESIPSTSAAACPPAQSSVIDTNTIDRSQTCLLPCVKPLHPSRQYFPLTLMRQRKVYTLLGIMLLFLNIFSWIGIAALILTSNGNTISLGRNILLPLFTTICLNSAVNPIVYTTTIVEFRSALYDILLDIYKSMKC